MKSRIIITYIILSVAAAAIASACSSGPGGDDAPCRQDMAEAGLPDEEKIMYDLYREKQEQGDRQNLYIIYSLSKPKNLNLVIYQ